MLKERTRAASLGQRPSDAPHEGRAGERARAQSACARSFKSAQGGAPAPEMNEVERIAEPRARVRPAQPRRVGNGP
jgi:hypothetical protein